MSRLAKVDRWEMFTLAGQPVHSNGRFMYEIGKSNKCFIQVTSLGERRFKTSIR